MTLYSDGTNASIHANKWYIDAAGKAYLNTGEFSGAITSSATITGGTLQTASSGQRVVITGTSINFYPSSGNPAAWSAIAADTMYTADTLWVNANFKASGSKITMDGLPTSDPSIAGDLWNNSGVLTVSAG